MLSLCIRAESQKLRRSPIWLACFLLPLIPALYGTYNYLQNTGILTGKWYSLWSQLTLFYAIFFYVAVRAFKPQLECADDATCAHKGYFSR